MTSACRKKIVHRHSFLNDGAKVLLFVRKDSETFPYFNLLCFFSFIVCFLCLADTAFIDFPAEYLT